jgi:hypothetical protein
LGLKKISAHSPQSLIGGEEFKEAFGSAAAGSADAQRELQS